MSSEVVIELSIEETDKLRAKLGLKPLLVGTKNTVATVEASPMIEKSSSLRQGDNNEEGEALELSIEETNKLRERLGLAPLRDTVNIGNKNKTIHKPAENTGHQEEASRRIERSKLRRQVEEGASQVFGSSTLAIGDEIKRKRNFDGNGNEVSLSWADMMRQQVKAPEGNNNKKTEEQGHIQSMKRKPDYNESDLEGLKVRNNMASLEAGENVLTLVDTSILETKTFISDKVIGINDEEDALENIKFSESEKQRDGLRKKRMLEMGMGRAGGYAGFDDDEFEELGGTLGQSSQDPGMSKKDSQIPRDFRLGSQMKTSETSNRTDYDKVMKGEAISLVWKGDVVTSDYMTRAEELEAKQKKTKKETKFKKKKKHKKKRRTALVLDGEDEEGVHKAEGTKSDANLLSKLEKTADSNQSSSLQKRRRFDDIANDEQLHLPSNISALNQENHSSSQPRTNRTNYDEIMEKGNKRTNKAFNMDIDTKTIKDATMADEDLDDSFLNAALAKARRLNLLRGINKSSTTGANAVVKAVQSTSVDGENSKQSSGISFSIDGTREFSRAIRARTQQVEIKLKRNSDTNSSQVDLPKQNVRNSSAQTADETTCKLKKPEGAESDEELDDEDMVKLAKEVQEDSIHYGFDGSTAGSVGVGRGLSSFVSMLKTTGEITGRHGGKEELRGRAKDERNYDNYEPLDLSKVVAIGENRTSKDEELANREIKLEYRDKHGRLLTQKEAYRELCYQFHGHGASKRKEEKRLKQIVREQAEARLASRQVSAARDGTTAGTLGALKATQEATGKAFIVHKI